MIVRTLGISLLSALGCVAQELPATLTGTVTDPFGSPIKNVRVQLEPDDRNGPSFFVTGDDSGLFRITSLPPATYRLELFGPGLFRPTIRTGIRLLAGQHMSIPNLVLHHYSLYCDDSPTIDAVQHVAPGDDSGTLRGSLLDSSGAPVNGAAVSLNCAACVTKTNQAGEFIFAKLKPGSYVIAISKDGYYREFLPHYSVFKNLDWTYAPIQLERCPAEDCERVPRQEKISPRCE
ncbi:MAG TPA: carboxypeptidase-like regulatory domain-containing protein [Bryobacteraceae bacterium]|nr:carboxypeptidase-like regulatory domain-containing protein [Bryobacteraceae bacterium]